MTPEMLSVRFHPEHQRERENDGNQKSPGVTPRTSDSQRQVLIWNNNLP